MTNAHSRLRGVDLHEAGALSVWCGVVAGYLTAFADALSTPHRGVSPEGVLDAIRRAGVDLLVDTARRKAHEQHTRPTHPSRRCLAMTARAFERLQVATGQVATGQVATGQVATGQTPAEGTPRGTPDHASEGAVRPATVLDTPPPAEEKTENVKVRMSPTLRNAAEEEADRAGRSLSSFIREAMREKIQARFGLS